MLSGAILLGFLIVAAYTDWRRRLVYNATTYPGMLIALAINFLASWQDVAGAAPTLAWFRIGEDSLAWWGCVGWQDCLLGWLVCGGAMVLAALFLGGVGGGDVKLLAMMGAFLGVRAGIEAMLWTFLIAAGVAICYLIWRYGAGTILAHCWRYVAAAVRYRQAIPLTSEERRPLQIPLFLSPSALAAAVVVMLAPTP